MHVLSIFLVYIFTLSASNASKFVLSNEKVSFLDGYIRCKQSGLDPAEILSEEEERQLEKDFNELNAIFLNGWPTYWIFATRMGNQQNFVWLNSGKPLVYSNFYVGEPKKLNNSEHCAEIFKYSSGSERIYKWNKVPCEGERKFICQTRSRNCQVPNDGNGTLKG